MRKVLDNPETPPNSAPETVPFTRFVSDAQFQGNGGEPSEISKWGGARANSGGYRPGSGRKPNIIVTPEPTHFSRDLYNAVRWYCIRTLLNEDITADIQTRIAGFEVFAPMVWKPPTPTKRDRNGVVHPGLPARIEPMFRSYFFTRFRRSDPEWPKIRGLPGVRTILSSADGSPIPVPDLVIEAIRAPLHANGCDYGLQTPAKIKPLDKGAKVRVTSGPMADFVGLCQMSDGKRLEVLMHYMGGDRIFKMEQSDVEVVR